MMRQKLKAYLRQVLKRMATWPGVGRIIRILASMERFQTQQLPVLLKTVSDINSRSHAFGEEQRQVQGAIASSLRKLTRESVATSNLLQSTRLEFERLQASAHTGFEQRDKALSDHTKHNHAELGELRRTAEYLLGRVEFVRREVLYEMQFGAKQQTGTKTSLDVQTRVIDQDKLTQARQSSLRLNVGCGHVALPDYINVDRRELPGVDLVAEVTDLPFDESEVDEFFSSHVLEHFPQEQLRRQLLPNFLKILKPGGMFRAVVPDGQASMKHYVAGTYRYEDLREVFYGAQDYDGDFHFNMFTPESLSALLEEAGFVDITIVAADRRNGQSFEFEIAARKSLTENHER